MILERQDNASLVLSQPPVRHCVARRGKGSAGCKHACIFPEKQDYKGKDGRVNGNNWGTERKKDVCKDKISMSIVCREVTC